MLLSKGYALAILASISSIAHIDCVQAKNASVLRREYGRNSKVRTGKRSGLRFVPNSSHRALKSPSKGKGSGDTETVSAPSKGKGSGDTMLSQELGSRSGFTNECYVHLLDLASNTVNIQDASAPTKGSYSSKGKSFSLRAPQRRLSSSKGSSKGSTSGTANTEENPEKDAAFSIEKYSKCVKEATNDLIGDIKIPAERRILIELLVSLQGDTGMMESLTSLDHCDLDWVSCDDGLITKIDLSLKGLKGVLPSNMKGLTSLLELNLTGTNLSFDVNLFTKLPKSLKKMFFSEISYLPTKEDLNALKDLTSLIDFVYNYNGVTHELAYLPFLENVKRVFLKGNLMTCIPVFGENTQLQLLDLECNDIYAINNVCGVFGKESQLIITGNTHIIQESLAFISDCTNVIVTQNEKFQCKNKENQENLDEVPSAQSAPSKGKGSIDAVPPNPAPIQPNLCDPTSCIGANEVCNDSSGIIVCDCEIGFDHVGGDCVSEPGKVCDPASCIGANEVCNDSSGIIVCECEIGFQRNLDGNCEELPFDPIDDSFGCIEQPDFAMTDPKCTSTIGIQATRSNISAGTVTLKMVYGGKDIAGLLTEGFYYTVTANIVGSGDCTVIPYENPERPEGACENMKSQIGSTTESGELWSEAILTYRLGGYEEKCCIDEIDVSGENILIDHGFVAGFDTEFTVAIHFDLLLEGCGDDDDVPQTAWAMHPVGDCPLSDPDYLVVASRHGWGKAVVFKTPASAS